MKTPVVFAFNSSASNTRELELGRWVLSRSWAVLARPLPGALPAVPWHHNGEERVAFVDQVSGGPDHARVYLYYWGNLAAQGKSDGLGHSRVRGRGSNQYGPLDGERAGWIASGCWCDTRFAKRRSGGYSFCSFSSFG
jgi:hypothetical protein